MIRSLHFLGPLLVCLLLLGPGCSSDEETTEPEVPEFSSLSGTLGPAGGKLTSSDNRLSVTIPPGALSEDTEIAISEIDPSGMDRVFADFVALTVLDVEPIDLTLAAPAEIRFLIPSPVERRALPEPDDPEECDLILGTKKDGDGAKVPKQRIRYDLDEDTRKDIEITMETMDWDQFAIGRMFRDDILGKFRVTFGPTDPNAQFMMRMEIPFQMRLDLPDENCMEYGETIYDNDPLIIDVVPGRSPGEVWTPDSAEHVDNDRVIKTFNIDMTPTKAGEVRVGARLGGRVRITDSALTGIPNLVHTQWDEIIMELGLPRVQLQVEDNPEALPLTIDTDMIALKGLDVAYESVDDPAPRGEPRDPWVYVVGNLGIRYYRLVMNEQDVIQSTQLISSIQLVNMTGVTVITAGPGAELTRFLYMNGTEGAWVTYWNPPANDYGMLGGTIQVPVHDAAAYGGIVRSHGMSIARGYAAEFIEYDAGTKHFVPPTTSVAHLHQSSFPGVQTQAVSCFVHEEGDGALIVWDGTPGQIWYHARSDPEANGIQLGHSQDEPKMLRGAGNVYAISNFASNSLSIFTWSGGASIGNTGTINVGKGPIGIDAKRLSDSSVFIVSTSDEDNTYTITHLTGTAGLLRQKTYTAPGACSPMYAAFLDRGKQLYVVLTCDYTGNIEIVPVDMDDFE